MPTFHASRTSAKAPPVKIDNLRNKLHALYAWAWQAAPLSPGGKATSGAQRLAGLLGVTPQNIAIWVNGADGLRATEMLPAKHLRPLCEDIFGIPQEVFAGPLPDFLAWLKTHPPIPPLTWRALTAQAEGLPGFRLQRRELPADFFGDRMGIAYAPEDDEEPLPSYRTGEPVRIEIDLAATDWASRATSDTGIGLVLLVEDRDQTTCLCPSTRQPLPPGPLPAGRIGWPPLPGNTPPEQWPRITAPVGRQALYAILSERPLAADSEFHRAFVAGGALDERLLDRYGRWLKQDPLGKWEMFRYRYAVQ